jgi:hypothetical protein
MTRCRNVCAKDHSPSTDTSTVPAGIAATRLSVPAHVCSSAAQAARRPSGSLACRSARPGKRRLSSASTSGITSTPLTRKKLSPSKSHGESISTPCTSTPRMTTPDRSAPTNRAPRRSAPTNCVPCRSSDRVKVATTPPCRAPCCRWHRLAVQPPLQPRRPTARRRRHQQTDRAGQPPTPTRADTLPALCKAGVRVQVPSGSASLVLPTCRPTIASRVLTDECG